ncbi:hypothetical protein WS66_27900 [Burkholderia sp. LA-2-3-30-S1-D2]|nr:hypothetical protein WS66_27900 [Burkholderia sp. LA-2-3-30-S1-D2]KVE12767.1 hypothetical protein WS66_15945 [Burkholderia sp. LA-2-3-30-S1-D2]
MTREVAAATHVSLPPRAGIQWRRDIDAAVRAGPLRARLRIADGLRACNVDAPAGPVMSSG